MFGVDELGMDLGTSTLHIVVRGKGIVLSEPAYVAYDRQTRNVVAVGEEARRMYGRTPAGLIVERPLRDGRIRSFDLVSKMLRYFMRKVIGKRATFRPKLLLALPGGMAPSERQTLVDVLVDAGVRSVVPVDESVASAIGAGMRIDQPYGRMNIDIGGGRTNVSVFSFGHQIVWDILNVGGDRFDDAIIDYLRKKHNLLIGARTAEELKIDIGSARMRGVKLEMDACGRSLVSGLPRAVTVSSEEMIEALDEGGELPIDIRDATIYYMGPSPAREGRPIGSAGPTTATRMDKYAPRLLDLGEKAMIGKGKRSKEVVDAVIRNHAVYFAAIGGAGALLSKCITKSEIVCYEDLGAEAIRKIEVKDFPVIVVIDREGNNLYETAIQQYHTLEEM